MKKLTVYIDENGQVAGWDGVALPKSAVAERVALYKSIAKSFGAVARGIETANRMETFDHGTEKKV